MAATQSVSRGFFNPLRPLRDWCLLSWPFTFVIAQRSSDALHRRMQLAPAYVLVAARRIKQQGTQHDRALVEEAGQNLWLPAQPQGQHSFLLAAVAQHCTPPTHKLEYNCTICYKTCASLHSKSVIRADLYSVLPLLCIEVGNSCRIDTLQIWSGQA